MRILLLLLFSLSIAQAQHNYKKIVLGSFSDIKYANEHLAKSKMRLSKDSDFTAEQEKLHIDFVVEEGRKFFTVVIKPFAQSKDVIRTVKIVRKYQGDAFIKRYVSDKPLIKASPVIEVKKELVPIVTPVVVQENNKSQTKEIDKNSTYTEVVVKSKKEIISPAVKAATVMEAPAIIPITPIAPKRLFQEEYSKQSSTFFDQYALLGWVLALIFGLLGFLLLITNRKLRRAKEILEDEQFSIDTAIKSKDEFLAKMSHEIRTPMNAIVGFSHILLDTKLDTDQLDSLSKIKGSADILLEIINDILDFSKLEAGMFKLEKIEFNVNTILENAANLVAVEANKRNLEFVFDIDHDVPIKLIGDPLRVDTILINLLSNAVKFTEKGEVVLKVVNVKSDNESEFILDFEIKDTGIGIAKEKISELFQSFAQADNSTTREYGGTGLGLVITKELVELMGGTVTLESEVGVGTSVKFRLHFDQPEHIEKRKYRLPSKEIMKKKVLIVDANGTAADSLTRMISYYQYSSDVVDSMDGALYALKILSYDIVCIDSKIVANDIENFINVISEKTSAKIVLLNGGIKNYQNVEGIDSELFKPFNQQDLFNTILDLYQPNAKELPAHSKGITKQDLRVLAGSTILLAEDNIINQSVIKSLLRESGVNLIIANDGQEAIDVLFGKNQIDLILMDISMPVLNGYDAASKIREDERFNELPILALTANALSSDVLKSKEVGMQEHMSKPLNVEQFYRALLKYITHRSETHIAEDELKQSTSKVPRKHVAFEFHAIKRDDGVERAGGDEELYAEILVEFEKLYKHSSRDLEKCKVASNFEEGQKLCHDIKGVSANIGAYKLSESVKNLEYSFKSKSSESISSAIISYNRELEKVLIDIRGYIEKG